MRPIEPPPSQWQFPPVDAADEDGLVGVGADLEPGTLLAAYRHGLFPMPVGRNGPMGWWSPDPRGVLPLDEVRVSRSLRRSFRRYEVRVDTAFESVMRACGEPSRPGGWMTEPMVAAYARMHAMGWAHSVETWSDDGELVGGLYGLAIGGFFAGESMFSRRVDASKVALVALVDRLRSAGYRLLDVQWATPHLRTLGVIELPRPRYVVALTQAQTVEVEDAWGKNDTVTERDRPWLMRTYSGHSNAKASNELYRTNLAKGQTGLSIAFDLPTQTGYDPDSPMAKGEVGKVGVPVAHLGHMRTLLDGIPPGQMNTSMTINATAAWLLGLYVANAEEHGVATADLRGTTQNDIVKEYLSRGTYIFPPEPSRRLIVDMVAWCAHHSPKWNPINVCSYHLQEAGATPVQEIAYALATAIGVLDAVRDSGQVEPDRFPAVFGSISFFVNAGIRFVDEICKLRAMADLWDRIGIERYGITDASLRRFRYGVQVNSLGLTENQPENNVQRIILEMLAVTLSKRARARSIQLPAWNEALGLPRPWDQQWSLRMQQVLAYETDLLEHDDIFDGSTVMEARTKELAAAAWVELEDVLSLGGAFEAIEEIKGRLVRSLSERTRRIESGEQVVVGLNAFTETTASPLEGEESILRVDPQVEADMIADVVAWRSARSAADVEATLSELATVAASGANVMPATIACAKAGVTTGEWAQTLRDVFGEYRAPTGVAAAVGHRNGDMRDLAAFVATMPGGPPRFLVAKPGLDGHSNGAEQIAVAARDAGMEVVYSGIRLTPEQIAASARDEDVDVVGLSILSGSHLELVPQVIALLRAEGVEAPVVVGGIIPEEDRPRLLDAGVAAVYTPKDFELVRIIDDIAHLVEKRRAATG